MKEVERVSWMKMLNSQILSLLLCLLISSCAGYINRVHRELDRDSAKQARMQQQKMLYQQVSTQRGQRRRNSSRDRNVSSRNRRRLDPTVRRVYQPKRGFKKRYRAEDLNDNTPAGSLWAGDGKDGYLISETSQLHPGDIVLINVKEGLKGEITAELKMAFPDRVIRKKKKEGEEKPAAPPAAPKEAKADGEEARVYDKVTSVVIEEVNQEYLLIRGRKNLIFKHRKRTIEVQALVARRDINANDSINSEAILETTVNVIR
jgi:flagellar L-ring protein FlgH